MTTQFLNRLGVDVFAADSTQQHQLGTRLSVVYGSNLDKSLECVYIEASAALTQGQICELPLIAGTDAYDVDAPLTKTNGATIADAQNEIFAAGVALATLADTEFGWFAVKGLVPVLVAASCAAKKPVGLTATAGVIDDADTDYEVVNLYAIEAVGGSQALTDCFVPHDILIKRNAV